MCESHLNPFVKIINERFASSASGNEQRMKKPIYIEEEVEARQELAGLDKANFLLSIDEITDDAAKKALSTARIYGVGIHDLVIKDIMNANAAKKINNQCAETYIRDLLKEWLLDCFQQPLEWDEDHDHEHDLILEAND